MGLGLGFSLLGFPRGMIDKLQSIYAWICGASHHECNLCRGHGFMKDFRIFYDDCNVASFVVILNAKFHTTIHLSSSNPSPQASF